MRSPLFSFTGIENRMNMSISRSTICADTTVSASQKLCQYSGQVKHLFTTTASNWRSLKNLPRERSWSEAIPPPKFLQVNSKVKPKRKTERPQCAFERVERKNSNETMEMTKQCSKNLLPYCLHDEANDNRQAYTATHHSYHYGCYFSCRDDHREKQESNKK